MISLGASNDTTGSASVVAVVNNSGTICNSNITATDLLA